MHSIKAQRSVVRSASIDGAVFLTPGLEAFLRDPGPGDPTYYAAAVLPDGSEETVGCVGESYEDRLFDTIWMARCAMLRPGANRAAMVMYPVRINGVSEWLSTAPYRDGIILDRPARGSTLAG